MDDKALDYVRDDTSGRTFVVRQDVEAMKAGMEAAAAEPGELAYPFLAEPEVRAIARLAAPEGPVEWGDSEASAREDRGIIAAFASLRRAAEESEV